MHFEFVYGLPPYLQEVGALVDSKCWNTVILTGLTYTLIFKKHFPG